MQLQAWIAGTPLPLCIIPTAADIGVDVENLGMRGRWVTL